MVRKKQQKKNSAFQIVWSWLGVVNKDFFPTRNQLFSKQMRRTDGVESGVSATHKGKRTHSRSQN